MSALKTLIYGQAKKFGSRSTSLLKLASDTRLRRISDSDEAGLIALFSALNNYNTLTEYMILKIHELLQDLIVKGYSNRVVVVQQGETFTLRSTFSTGTVYPDMVLVVKDEEIIEGEQQILSQRVTKEANENEIIFVINSFPYTSNSIRFASIYVEPENFTGLNVTTLFSFCVVVTTNNSSI